MEYRQATLIYELSCADDEIVENLAITRLFSKQEVYKNKLR